MHSRRNRSEIAVGCALGLLAIGVWYATSLIAVSPGYAFVGPRAFPYGVAALLGVLGLGFVLAGFWDRAEASPADEPTQQLLRPNLSALWVVGGFAANLIGLSTVGFVIAAAIQYAMTARGFGSRRPLVDLAYGLVFAAGTFFLFTRLLGVFIRPGPLWEMIS